VEGRTSISRGAFNVGEGQWVGTETIGGSVAINFAFSASH
jgi:hypothetical protein